VEGPTPPWFPGGLVAELEELLGCRVHVVEPDSIREGLKEAILGEAVPLQTMTPIIHNTSSREKG